MNMEWMVLEILAILIENFMFIYFLHKRFASKYERYYSPWLVWGLFVAWGLLSAFLHIPGYEVVSLIGMFMYLLVCKSGSMIQKLSRILLLVGVALSSSMFGERLAAGVTSAVVNDIAVYQDVLRLFEIVFVQLVQIEIFYILVNKDHMFHHLKRTTSIVLTGATIINLIYFALICVYIEHAAFDIRILIWLVICFLLMMIALFSMYELFVREETTNIDLSVQLQRFELETQFYKEIDAMYSDMRTWRHEYKNNLIALRALIAHEEKEKALKYIDYIACESLETHVTLQTGNLILDAVVSSKLWLAQSRNIQVSVQAVYPENNQIDDTDLCAIAGNLLDNAIEACERIVDPSERRFIHFSLMLKGKSLFLLISNSYDSELKRDGVRYLTLKKGCFHGIGIPYVDSIVDKYQGHVRRFQKSGVFETHVMLPLLPPVVGE